MARTLGILLAGGRGERLALGRPKALAPLAGRTLLERAIETLREACDALVVCAPASMELPVDPAERVADPPAAGGPLAGLVAGLASQAFTRALALGVDFPCVRAGSLRALARALAHDLALVPAPGGRLQPLVAAYAPAALAPLAESLASGERALVPAVSRLGPRRLDDAALAALGFEPDELLNVNEPDDLARAARRLAAGAGA